MLLSFIIYTIGIILIGTLLGGTKDSESRSFFLADRKLGPWVTALSAGASSESAWSFLGLTGAAYLAGNSAFWLLAGVFAGYVFNFFILGPRLRKYSQEINAITLPDVLSTPFNNSLAIRLIASIIIFLTMIAYVVAQLTGAGKALNASFNINYEWGVIIGAVIILSYTFNGGFKAASITDSIQALIMIISMIALPIYVLWQVGGFTELYMKLNEIDTANISFLSNKVGWAALGMIGGWVGIGLGYMGLPHQLNRLMAIKEIKQLKIAGIVAISWSMLLYAGAIIFGISLRVLVPDFEDPEQILPFFVSTKLPSILSGFILAAIISAISSTADSQLLVSASAISHDILNKVFHISPKNINRYLVLFAAILAVILALTEVRVIFQFVLYAWAILGAAFGPPLIAILFWKNVKMSGVVGGMISGTITTIVWRELGLSEMIVYEIIPAVLISTFMTFFLSKIFNKN